MADYIKWIRSKVGHAPIMTVAVVAFLENEHKEVLLQQRTDTGLWDIPGGIVEFGESFETALRREIQEEVNLEEFEILQQFGAYTWGEFTYPNGDIVQPTDICYVCRVSKEKVNLDYQDDETQRLECVNLKTLDFPLFNPKMQRAINDYLKLEKK